MDSGSSNQQGCGARLVLTTPDKVVMEYALHFKFKASNNEAEYETLLTGLRLAKHLGVKQIDIFSDSQLVVNHVTNNFDVKDNSIAAYLTIPNTIVTDNGRQFDNKKFKMFCSKFNINLCFASPAHPQFNGQVEAINKIIKRTLKTSLDKAKGCWPEFAVVPVELKQATFRVQNYIKSENDKQLTINLDLVEEHRNQAHLRNVAYKQRIYNFYDSRVKPRSFKVGDWVLKKILLYNRVPSESMLSPNWMDRLKLLASVTLALQAQKL
ncbi:uncharacterized protein [Pyrus communis]|uniref:uncharacterized protein n=1 Tax=Pyrus communis TaxID=23211 RepID=UPI0035BFCCB2